MLRIVGLIMLCGLAITASVAPPAMAQSNVGFIDIQQAMINTAEITREQAAMEERFQPRLDEIQKLQEDLQDVQDKLQTMQGKLTVEAETELQLQNQRLQRDLTRKNEDLQADLDYERNEVLQSVAEKMQAVVEKMAQEKGLDAIVDVTAAVFVKTDLLLTDEATAAYDSAYPAE